jgi:hypothetical protein
MSESKTCLGLRTGGAEVQFPLRWFGDWPFIRSVDPLAAAPPRLARTIHFQALRSAARLVDWISVAVGTTQDYCYLEERALRYSSQLSSEVPVAPESPNVEIVQVAAYRDSPCSRTSL